MAHAVVHETLYATESGDSNIGVPQSLLCAVFPKDRQLPFPSHPLGDDTYTLCTSATVISLMISSISSGVILVPLDKMVDPRSSAAFASPSVVKSKVALVIDLARSTSASVGEVDIRVHSLRVK